MKLKKSGDNRQKADFSILRYANCWEDADILLEGLQPHSGSKILSVASAGDNSFSLLATDPEIVIAIDVNKIQLHLIALKKAAIQELSHEEILQFLGFQQSEDRIFFFEKIKHFLEKESSVYWEKNKHLIQNGIIHQGKFEQYFQLFCNKILPCIHSKKTTKLLLAIKSPEAQTEFYYKHWNTWRWRLLFKIFFGKYIMGKYGRAPEFLKEVKITVGPYIFKKAEVQLRSIAAQDNFILHYNLLADFGITLPHYLKPENFQLIKSNIQRLQIREGFIEDMDWKYGKFDCMNLSNIFEYMDQGTFEQSAEKIIGLCAQKGKIAYWNLMVPRLISNIFPEGINFLDDLSLKLSAKDKGFFYNQFIIEQKR
jgi:S-adenosylmethionine-diacylglycerol 3-amino-3-carboxypropyl transferase